jgi:2,3-bisphosphoglycerate-independent phosphoglycerate mutase
MKKVVLCILDGWGVAPDSEENAITRACTPTWYHLLKTYPHQTLQASEQWVGLLPDQMGNSEVGHMTLGLGRVIKQDLVRLNEIFDDRSIEHIPPFQDFLKTTSKDVHLMGLLSPGGVHSHQDHLSSMCEILHEKGYTVFFHAFLDGRDTPPMSAYGYVEAFQKKHPYIIFATLSGRYFSMDRDSRWQRIQKAYDTLCAPKEWATDPLSYIQSCYDQNITDEFIEPIAIDGFRGIKEGSNLLMMNFRADRVRQLLSALLFENFSEFDRQSRPTFQKTLGMTSYSSQLDTFITPLLEKQSSKNSLGEVVAQKGLKQLRIAETEKYAHVTYFFNGGRESPFEEEERRLIPSPKVATYDLKPSMSAKEITAELTKAIKTSEYSLIVVNYANTDMVGHTAVQQAAIEAVETVDACLKEVLQACLETQTVLVVTADHGNVECLKDPITHVAHTAHTLNPVPFIVADKHYCLKDDMDVCGLEDVAPTLLKVLDIEQPLEMTGKSLIKIA